MRGTDYGMRSHKDSHRKTYTFFQLHSIFVTLLSKTTHLYLRGFSVKKIHLYGPSLSGDYHEKKETVKLGSCSGL